MERLQIWRILTVLMTLPIVSEEIEQADFVQWLEMTGYKFTAIPNSTYTKSWKQKMKNKRTGLRAGFPDLIVIAEGRLICIEMKRTKGGQLTLEQRAWIDALAAAGIPVAVCKGAREAIDFVKSVVHAQPGRNKSRTGTLAPLF